MNANHRRDLIYRSFSLLLAAALLVILVSPAGAVPPLPSSFFGEIHISDSPPEVGNQVLAYAPDVAGAVGTATIIQFGSTLYYSINVQGDDSDTSTKDGAAEGDTISFYINNVPSRLVMTAVWHSGENTHRDIHPPDANPGGPYQVNEGASIQLSASDSADWGNDISLYEWDLDNNGAYDDAAGITTTFRRDDNGSYPVGLRVTDSQGGVGVDATIVTVSNVAPVVTAPPNQSAAEGASTSFDLGYFTDPGADSPWHVVVNWGDGSANNEFDVNSTGTLGSLSHTYADGRSAPYSVQVTVTDKDGGVGNASFQVTVSNAAPAITPPSNQTADEGTLTSFSLGSFSDANPSDGPWHVVVSWGDGSANNEFDVNSTGTLGSLSHTYANNQTQPYTVEVTVTDKDGDSDSKTFTVTVNNVTPIVDAGADATINEGDTFTQPGTFTDPGADNWAATVNYGDGGDSQPLLLTDKTFTLSHQYVDDGTYTITVQVSDGESEGIDTVQVTVNNVPPTSVSAGGPYIGTAGQPVNLHGSATCPAVDTCTYAWDLDNDGQYDDANGADPSHTWNHAGNYTIGLQVTDSDATSATASTTVTINPAQHGIELYQGWNLVSFSLIPPSTAIANVLSSVAGNFDLVYAWDAGSQTWLKYDNIPLSPDNLDTLDNTRGFWIHMTNADTLEIQGDVPDVTEITMYANWNLVGYPAGVNHALPAALADHGVGTDFSLVYAYHANDASDPWKLFDRTAPGWANDLIELSPGWGYWVKLTVGHTWTVSYTAQ